MCDDDKYFLLMITDMVKKYAEVYNAEVVSFYNGSELIEYCKRHTFEIVYLDIEVGKNNGIDMAKILKILNPKALIIYMSAYDKYFVPLANAEPFRFIYKAGVPNEVIERELMNTLNEAVKRIEGRDSFWYTYNKRKYGVLITKIQCIYSSGRRMCIISEEKIEQNVFYGKIDDTLMELEKLDSCFIKINRRVIANMLHTYYKETNKVEINRKLYTVSGQYRETFCERYKPYAKIRV